MRKFLIAVVVLVLLGAAADFVAARVFEDRVTTELQREYDKTMTKTEQAAAISDLAQEKARQEQAVKEDNSGTGGTAVPASGAPAATSKSAASSKPAAPAAPSNQAY